MTKQQEIHAWQTFSAAMPPETTYSGAWIAEQIHHLADAIRSDLPPECRAATMGECLAAKRDAHADAQQTRADARAHAQEIEDQAKAHAQEIRNAAHQDNARALDMARAALRSALHTLDR
jgi:cell division septum initiation protein DivIVA